MGTDPHPHNTTRLHLPTHLSLFFFLFFSIQTKKAAAQDQFWIPPVTLPCPPTVLFSPQYNHEVVTTSPRFLFSLRIIETNEAWGEEITPFGFHLNVLEKKRDQVNPIYVVITQLGPKCPHTEPGYPKKVSLKRCYSCIEFKEGSSWRSKGVCGIACWFGLEILLSYLFSWSV